MVKSHTFEVVARLPIFAREAGRSRKNFKISSRAAGWVARFVDGVAVTTLQGQATQRGNRRSGDEEVGASADRGDRCVFGRILTRTRSRRCVFDASATFMVSSCRQFLESGRWFARIIELKPSAELGFCE